MNSELENFDTKLKKISSWNLTYKQKALIVYPSNQKELLSIIKILKKKNNTFNIRTGKCSYDSKSISPNENGIIISLEKFNKIIQINKKKKFVLVESGIKISEILNHLKRNNLTLYSIPGGEHISIGGAIAANVIGKDSSKSFASFGDTIKYLKVISYNGKIKKIKKNSKELNKYIGSFGLFGIILEAKISTKKTLSKNLIVTTKTLKNINEVQKELNEKAEYKYIQINPFFHKKNFALAVNGNSVKNFDDIYKEKNLKANLFEVIFFKISSFFLNKITWKIFYKIFFILNKNKKYLIDIHNFHYTSKYKHMIPLICRGGLIDYEVLIKKNFNSKFLKIINFINVNKVNPIYIIVKKLFKSKKKYYYSFNDKGYAVAISFSVNELGNLKRDLFEKFLEKEKLFINLTKTDKFFIKKHKEIVSEKNDIFMSLYKKMLTE